MRVTKYQLSQLFTALYLGSLLVAFISESIWFLILLIPGGAIYLGLFWIFFPHLLK